MKLRHLSDFFAVGYSSAVLHRIEAGASVDLARHFVASLRDSLIEEGFRVSLGVFDETLARTLAEVESEGSQVLSSSQASDVRSSVANLIVTMKAELVGIPVYSVSEKRYAYAKLNDGIDRLFKEGAFVKLPEIAQFDFGEAGKCIVVDRATAAAFHCLRATEAVLRAFHDRLAGVPAREDATWGDMEVALAALPHGVDTALTEQLKHVRRRYRNQTQHPRLRYDIEEAQDLLNLCIELSNRMSGVL